MYDKIDIKMYDQINKLQHKYETYSKSEIN